MDPTIQEIVLSQGNVTRLPLVFIEEAEVISPTGYSTLLSPFLSFCRGHVPGVHCPVPTTFLALTRDNR